MHKRLIESQAFASATTDTPGRLQLQLITPGWGSSGFYSRQVLENAAADKVWPAGTHVFFDHPSESETFDRPERSVRDLAAILDEDARVDESGGLVATARVIGPYRDLMTDPVFIDAVGMSIRATGDSTIGEAEGRKGTLITRLIEGESVDVVTRAGRGGRILAAVESARAGMVREASTQDTRDRLSRAVAATHDDWSYVMDFDPEDHVVWFEADDVLYEQGYELTADAANLTGDPVQVRRVVTYPHAAQSGTDSVEESPRTPVAPAGSTTPSHESEEDTMPQIEEGRLAQLEADAGRVQTLEAERDAATAERDTERQARVAAENRAAAIQVIADNDHPFTALERRGLLVDLPVTEDGQLDVEAFTTTVTEAATERAAGTSGVRGFGRSIDESDTTADPWAEIDAHLGLTAQEA